MWGPTTLERMDRSTSQQENGHKIILHWTKFYSSVHEYVRQEDWYDKWCSVKKKCIGTMDRSILNEADAVVFHLFPSDWEVEDLPSQRSPSQYCVALINEPPSYSGVSKMLSQLPANFFNLSMTFRQDSQLPYTYLTTTKLSPYRQKGSPHNSAKS